MVEFEKIVYELLYFYGFFVWGKGFFLKGKKNILSVGINVEVSKSERIV